MARKKRTSTAVGGQSTEAQAVTGADGPAPLSTTVLMHNGTPAGAPAATRTSYSMVTLLVGGRSPVHIIPPGLTTQLVLPDPPRNVQVPAWPMRPTGSVDWTVTPVSVPAPPLLATT